VTASGSMSTVVLALVVGIAAFPLLLVFGPAYFRRACFCWRPLAASWVCRFALNPRMLVAVILWSVWLLPPIALGVLAGDWLRARAGIVRGGDIGAGAALVIALIGTGLAFLAAPPEVANAPTCDNGFECPRTQCAYMAERRRFLAIERVTAFDGERITCTYTAWGGIAIGRSEMGRGGGSWTGGAWPLMFSGRQR
jgi:hypothetical protein